MRFVRNPVALRKYALAAFAAASIAAPGLARAAIVFESSQGDPAASAITNGTNVFGYLTAFTVSRNFELTMIEQRQWQAAAANMKFVVFDNDTDELLFELLATVSADTGGSDFANATYKSSGPISFILHGGRNYMIGTLTDGSSRYWGEASPTAGDGIAALAANRNAIGFAPPILGSQSFCCDNYVRLTLEEVPEPESAVLLAAAAGGALWLVRRHPAGRGLRALALTRARRRMA